MYLQCFLPWERQRKDISEGPLRVLKYENFVWIEKKMDETRKTNQCGLEPDESNLATK